MSLLVPVLSSAVRVLPMASDAIAFYRGRIGQRRRKQSRLGFFTTTIARLFMGNVYVCMSAVNKQSMTYIRMAQSGANRVTFLFMSTGRRTLLWR